MGAIVSVTGRGLPLRGDDLDTDRIMPARFLRAVTFEGLEHHVFEDDRAADPAHPFGNPRYLGASVLVVNRNFGCGSSREHAPQGLVRFGIRVAVGESFSEIFQGNASVLGLPCLAAERGTVTSLQSLVEQHPDMSIEVRIDTGLVTAGTLRFQALLPPAVRDAFLTDRWDPTSMLLDHFDEVRAVAGRLAYTKSF